MVWPEMKALYILLYFFHFSFYLYCFVLPLEAPLSDLRSNGSEKTASSKYLVYTFVTKPLTVHNTD